MSEPIRVLLVDDHELVRAGLRSLLSGHPEVAVVGEAADGAAACALVGGLNPQVILMDISMPIMDGIAATREILGESPQIAIIILTSFADQAKVRQALAAGAVGYLLKDGEPSAVLTGIRAAAAGYAPIDPKVARVLLPGNSPAINPAADAGLSPRETEVLRLIAEGLPNKQIARKLGIAERTVKVHIGNVFKRIDVADRTSAALWCRDHLPAETGTP